MSQQGHNIIKGFALVCVAVTSAYVMYMGWWLVTVLSGPDWCSRALGADITAAWVGALSGSAPLSASHKLRALKRV